MDQTRPLSSTVAILIGTASKRSQVMNLKQPFIVAKANGAGITLIDKQPATCDQRATAPNAGRQCQIREFRRIGA
jgi:hypothetical protein